MFLRVVKGWEIRTEARMCVLIHTVGRKVDQVFRQLKEPSVLWDKKVSPSNIFAFEASPRAFFGAGTSLLGGGVRVQAFHMYSKSPHLPQFQPEAAHVQRGTTFAA